MEDYAHNNSDLNKRVEALKKQLKETDRELIQFLIKVFPAAESLFTQNGIPKKIYLSENLYKLLGDNLLMIKRFRVVKVEKLEPEKMILIWPGEEAKEAEIEKKYSL